MAQIINFLINCILLDKKWVLGSRWLQKILSHCLYNHRWLWGSYRPQPFMLTSIHLQLMGNLGSTFFETKMCQHLTLTYFWGPKPHMHSNFAESSSLKGEKQSMTMKGCDQGHFEADDLELSLMWGDLFWATMHTPVISNSNADALLHGRKTATMIHLGRFGRYALPVNIWPFEYNPLSSPWSKNLVFGTVAY